MIKNDAQMESKSIQKPLKWWSKIDAKINAKINAKRHPQKEGRRQGRGPRRAFGVCKSIRIRQSLQ
jgi:hypothetical protein